MNKPLRERGWLSGLLHNLEHHRQGSIRRRSEIKNPNDADDSPLF